MDISSLERILIVEDDALQAEQLRSVLSEAGYKVVGVAPESGDAVRLAMDEHPDLAVVDVRLRGSLDGITTARHLSERCGVRIVFVSGHLEEAVLQARDIARGFLNKPYSNSDLHSVIRDALRR